MNFMQTIRYAILLQCFCILGLCQEKKTKTALVLTKRSNKLVLTKPIYYNPKTQTASFKAPEKGKTYLFCNHSKKVDEKWYLSKIGQVKNNQTFEDSNACEHSAQTVLIKVTNPRKLKKVAWNKDEMELYHSGYMLDLEKNSIRKSLDAVNFWKIKPVYENWNTKYTLFAQIEIYYNKKTQRTLAVEYNLLSTNLSHYDMPLEKEKIAYSSSKEHLKLNNHEIFIYTDSIQYLDVFEGKINDETMTKLDAQESENGLITASFAPNEHFPIPLWSRPSAFRFNLVPMWRKPHFMWKRVQKFSRIVAKYLGDLKITSGITNTMTLSNTKVVDRKGFEIPKYFWNVIEYRTKKTFYGIIAVLNHNSFEPTDEKICEKDGPINCENYGWIISNQEYSKGEIYCCEMTNRNIENLKAQFLPLRGREILNLYAWKDESQKIIDEYMAYLRTELDKNWKDD